MNNLGESMEDYLESIFILEQDLKVVRVKDLMQYFGYKVSSVNSAIKILGEKGLVQHEKYSYIELTAEGRKIAEGIYKRHENIYYFFHKILGADKNTARNEACKIEHILSHDTYVRFIGFIKYIEQTHSQEEILRGIETFKDSVAEEPK